MPGYARHYVGYEITLSLSFFINKNPVSIATVCFALN